MMLGRWEIEIRRRPLRAGTKRRSVAVGVLVGTMTGLVLLVATGAWPAF